MRPSTPVTVARHFCEEFDISPEEFYQFLGEIGWPLVGRGFRYQFDLVQTVWLAQQLQLWKEHEMGSEKLVEAGAVFGTRDLPDTPVVGKAEVTAVERSALGTSVTFVYEREGFRPSTRTLALRDILFFLDRGAWHAWTDKPDLDFGKLSVGQQLDYTAGVESLVEDFQALCTDYNPVSVKRALADLLDETWEDQLPERLPPTQLRRVEERDARTEAGL